MSLSKHLLNDPSAIVVQSLQGLCAANPQLALDEANKVVFVNPAQRAKQPKVALICGGGAGHEPAHAGFVGHGMLDAAVCGNVFASPSTTQVLRGIDLVDNEKGTVIFVKNYTGDVLNFGLAKEQYAVQHPDKAQRVRFVSVGDDVAVGRTQGALVGRRGLAGTVLVYKIAGALAAQGADLDEVEKVSKWVASRIGTIGVGLEHCHVPGTAVSESHLKADEVEIGMGIHNEPGHQRRSPVPPLPELVSYLLELIASTKDDERSFVPFKGDGKSDKVVVLVNNLGGLSELEMGGITGVVVAECEKRGLGIERVLSGAFMTSLNMPGFSLSLLLLPSHNESNVPADSSTLLSLLDAPTETPGWKWSGSTGYSAFAGIPKTTEARPSTNADVSKHPKLHAADPEAFIRAVKAACEGLVQAEPEITRMDSIAGDGDCGLTLKAGATGVLKGIQNGQVSGEDAIGTAKFVADVAEKHMGGTSGALYSIFFSALASALQTSSPPNNTVTAQTWAHAVNSALTKLYTYTRARAPSRTLIDPLSTFVNRLASSEDAAAIFGRAVEEAGESAVETRYVEAKAGRSAYTESEKLMGERVSDPGAWGVKVILEGLWEGSQSA